MLCHNARTQTSVKQKTDTRERKANNPFGKQTQSFKYEIVVSSVVLLFKENKQMRQISAVRN